MLRTLKEKFVKFKSGKILYVIYKKIISIPRRNLYASLFKFKQKKIRHPKFYDDLEVFHILREKRLSMARYGDGEISWMFGKGQEYFGQKNSEELSIKLFEIIESENDNLIIGIPNFFNKNENYSKERIKNRNAHLFLNLDKWNQVIDSDVIYADALMTRAYNGRSYSNAKKLFNQWKSVWNDKEIVIIEGEDTKFGVNNDLLNNAKKISRIIAPSRNAFSKYNSILDVSLKNVNSESIILVALGPTATILVSDLSKKGYQSIDIGHLDIEYEWYLQRAENKIPIRGKFVNEAGGAPELNLSDEELEVYNDQIIARV